MSAVLIKLKKTLRFYKDLLLLQRIDENVHSQLRDKNADRLQRLQRGYVECVLFVCFENSSFVHWNKVTFPRVRAHTSINCMY